MLAAGLAALAVIVAVSGGFRTTVGGLRISARSPLPIAFLAFTNAAMWYFAARRQGVLTSDLESAWRGIERHATRIIVSIAVVSAILTMTFATRSAAGADASGYVSEAKLLAGLSLFHEEPLTQVLPNPDGWLLTPLGWRPASSGARQAPTYPPGLPLLMAVPHALAGVTGAAMVVVVSGFAAVIAAGLLALRLGGGGAGLIAAALIASTPVFLYQAIQPMSDVPVTAAWAICFLLVVKDRSLAAGVACALAVLIRPNLAPLAIVPLVIANQRARFAAPVAGAAALLGWLQWTWYGSPLQSGYGAADQLFAVQNAGPNAIRYATWLFGTAPVLLVGLPGLWRMRSSRTTQGLIAFVALVVMAYLFYGVFEDWPYLRFLLPALAVLAVFAGVEMVAWIRRAPERVRAPLLFAMILGITAHQLSIARDLEIFRLASRHQRVGQVADFVNAKLPVNAVLIAGEQSGSMRHYTGRSILRWEAAAPDQLLKAIAMLEGSGRPVFIVLDAWEHEPFRARFSGLADVGLDWPAAIDAGSSNRTRLWRLSDRPRFLRGEHLDTIRRP